MPKKTIAVEMPYEAVREMIFYIRGQKVMIDKDLATLYGVPTKVFNQAVKRNINRFPGDFMFRLTRDEFDNLRSQFVTSRWGGQRYMPYVFTEQGVAMLSSVLNNERAIQVNIAIMRAFTKLREMISGHKDLKERIDQLERKYDGQFRVVFKALKALLEEPAKEENPIGFHAC